MAKIDWDDLRTKAKARDKKNYPVTDDIDFDTLRAKAKQSDKDNALSAAKDAAKNNISSYDDAKDRISALKSLDKKQYHSDRNDYYGKKIKGALTFWNDEDNITVEDTSAFEEKKDTYKANKQAYNNALDEIKTAEKQEREAKAYGALKDADIEQQIKNIYNNETSLPEELLESAKNGFEMLKDSTSTNTSASPWQTYQGYNKDIQQGKKIESAKNNADSAYETLRSKGYTDEEIDDMLDFYKRKVDGEYTKEVLDTFEQMQDEGGFVGNVMANVGALSATLSPDNATAITEDVLTGLTAKVNNEYVDLNTNSPAHLGENVKNAVVSKTNEEIHNAVIENGGTETEAQIADFFYNTGFSTAQFAVTLPASSMLMTSGAGKILSESASLGILSTSAATNTAIEATERGLNADKAATLGIIAGAAEIITEHVSIDALFDSNSRGIKYILQNTLAEGSEEVGSDIINLIADLIVSGDKAQLRQNIQHYVDNNYSESEALQKALCDEAINMGLDFLGGALSGAALAGVSSASRKVYEYGNFKTEGNEIKSIGSDAVEAVINEGLAQDNTSPAYKAAADMLAQNTKTDTYEMPENVSSAKLGRLQQMNVVANDIDTFSEAVKGEENAKSLTNTFKAITEGKSVSKAQANEILNNTTARDALSQLTDIDAISSESKSNGKKLLSEVSTVYRNSTQQTFSAPTRSMPVTNNESNMVSANSETNSVLQKEPVSKSFTYTDGTKGSIDAIDSIKGGNVLVKTSNGEVVDINNINFDDEQTESLYKSSASYGNTNVARAYVTGFANDTTYDGSLADYNMGFNEVYKAQKMGKTFSQAYNIALESGSNITELQAMVAYDASKNEPVVPMTSNNATDNNTVAELQKAKIKAVKETTSNVTHTSGELKKALDSKVKPGATVLSKNVTKYQKAEIDVISDVAKKYNTEVIIVDEYGKSNGAYTKGKIILPLNNSSGMMPAYFGHELFHHLEDVSPAQAAELKEFVLNRLKSQESYNYNERFAELEDLYKNEVEAMSEAEKQTYLDTEISANACFTVFSNENNVKELVNKNKSLASKIKNFFEDFAKRIQNALISLSYNNKEYAALQHDCDLQKRILDTFNSALTDGQKNNTTNNGVVRLSAKESEDIPLKQQIRNNLEAINSTDIIVDVKTPTTFEGIDAKKWAIDLLKASSKIENADVGQIVLDEKRIKQAFRYLKSDEEIAAFSTVPAVIKDGIKIYDRTNHKGRDYPTISFAGRVKINNQEALVGVSLKLTTDNFYKMHRILMPDGTVFEFDENEKSKVERSVPLSTNDDDNTTAYFASNTNVSQNDNGVNNNSMQSIEKNSYKENVDSEGNALSEQQQEYFKDSKVRDEDGNLLVVYHGTNNREETDIWNERRKSWDTEYKIFTKFKTLDWVDRNGFFFADDYDNAGGYGSTVYKVYLNVTNPLIIECNGQNYSSIDFNGITHDTYEWAEYAKQNGYDGVIFRNIVDGVGYEYFEKPVNEFVAFKSNQIKNTDNLNPTEDSDIRFSLDVPVEETKDLIAVHNIREDSFLKTLELGGFAMPSIAIMKARQANANSDYGEISVVFNKDTIDPSLNKSNKVYSSDAWTPTFPTIEYQIDDNKASVIYSHVRELTQKPAVSKVNPVYFNPDNIESDINRAGGLDKFVDRLKDDAQVKQLYLAESDNQITEYSQTEIKTELTPEEKAECEYILENTPELVETFENSSSPRLWNKQYGEQLKKVREDFYKSLIPDITQEGLDNIFSNEPRNMNVIVARRASTYATDNGVSVRYENDYKTFNNELNERVNQADYEKWLNDLFKGIVVKSGIYNGKDYYTPNGDRRSFDTLHYEVTLENIVKAMKQQEDVGNSSIFSQLGLWGVAAKKYGTLDEIISDKSRLQTISTDEYSEIKNAFGERFDEIAESLENKYKSDNPYIDYDNKSTNILDCLRVSKTKSGLLNNLNKWFSNATETTVDDLLNLVADIGNMPTDYFEAKPQRAVELSEIAYVVVPDSASQELLNALKSNDISYRIYESGNEDSRVDVLNGFDDVKFSKKETTNDYTALLDENEELVEMNENLQRMLQLVSAENNDLREQFGIKTVRSSKDSSVNKVAANLRKTYGSNYNKSILVSRLAGLYDYISNAGDDIDNNYIWTTAKAIATDVLSSTTYKDTSMYDAYKDLRDYLRTSRIVVPETVREDMADYEEFRKRTFGRLRLVNSDGIPLDSLYAELSADYPAFFPEDAVLSEQLEYIEAAINATQPVYYNSAEMFAEDSGLSLDEYTNIVAADIFEQYFEVPEVKTLVSEKHQQEMEELQAEYKSQMESTRKYYIERYEGELEYLRKENAKRLAEIQESNNKALEKVTAEKLEALAKQKAHFKDVSKAGTERRKASDVKRKIKNLKSTLDRKLLSPNETSYVPTYLVQEIANVCDSITEAQRKWKNGNQKSEKTIMKLDSLHRQYEALKNDPDYDYSSEYDSEMQKKISALADSLNGKQISELTLNQLEDVYNVLKDIKNSLVDATKQIARDEKISNYDSRKRIITEIGNTRGMKNKAIGKYEFETLNTMRFVEMMCEHNENAELYKLFKELEEGKHKAYRVELDLSRAFYDLRHGKGNAKKFDAFVRNKVDTGLKDVNGNPLMMTEAQIAQVYLTAKREQGFNHFKGGGFTVYDAKDITKGKRADAKTKHAQRVGSLEYNELIGLYDLLSDYAKQWVVAADNMFNNQSSKYINETSLLLKHKKIASTKNYIPIKVNPDERTTNIEDLKFDHTIEGSGTLKSVNPKAKQGLIIEGLNSVIEEHIDFVSDYAGLAIPIRNINKVYGGVLSKHYEKSNTNHIYSVGAVLDAKWSTSKENIGRKIVENAISDLQNQRKRSSNKLKSAWIQSTLSGSMAVTLKQAASYPTAAAVLDGAILNKAICSKEAWIDYEGLCNEIDEHTGIHYIRRIGMSVQEIGEITKKENALLNKFPKVINPMKWIQAMDCRTTATLWVASKMQIEKDYPNVNKGSTEYWNKVTQLYERVIEETQPNYDTLHRAEIQKETSFKGEVFGQFKTQTLQNAGLMYNALDKWDVARREYSKNKTGENQKKLHQAQKEWLKVTQSQTVAALVLSAMTIFAKALTHQMDRYKDDDDEVTAENVIKVGLWDVVSTLLLDLAPIYGDEMWDAGSTVVNGINNVAHGESFNSTMFDLVQFPGVSLVNDFYTTSINLCGTIIKAAQGEADVGDVGESTKNLVFTIVSGFGGPAKNLYNIWYGVKNHAIDIANGKFLSFESDAKMFSLDPYSKLSDNEKLKKYLENGEQTKAREEINDIINKKIASGKTEKEAKGAIKTMISSAYKDMYVNGTTDQKAEVVRIMDTSGVYGTHAEVLEYIKKYWQD